MISDFSIKFVLTIQSVAEITNFLAVAQTRVVNFPELLKSTKVLLLLFAETYSSYKKEQPANSKTELLSHSSTWSTGPDFPFGAE